MSDNQLDVLRQQVDEIDRKLLLLLKKRFSLVLKISRHKHSQGIPLYDRKREALMMKQRKNLALKFHVPHTLIQDIFRCIFRVSRSFQRQNLD